MDSGKRRAPGTIARTIAGAAVALDIIACSGPQSALDVRGSGAERIAALWWMLLGVAVAVYAVVMVIFLGAVLRSRRDEREGVEDADQTRRRRVRRLIGGTVALTAMILGVVFVLTLRTQAALHAHATEDLTIEIIGRQWWWEIRYRGRQGEDTVITANEIHIPTGQRVRIEMTSADVIHSLWVPSLQGKTDLVPGRTLVTWLRADVPGISRGQCAEYCGVQHTHMGLLVVAQTPDEFARWLAEQRQPAPAPADTLSQRGQNIFDGSGCGYCHAVSGTFAAGSLGPDLTHFASRSTIAAATLANTHENLTAWLADPQRIKPGNLMPRVPLAPDAIDAVAHYLESLR
jgi:cytochrome c oxidase subunit 2